MAKKKVEIKYRSWICKCGVRYSVYDNDVDANLIPDRFKCWSKSADGKECRFYLKRNDKGTRAYNVIRAYELFQVINSMGSDVERRCAPAELKKLLGKKVIRMELEAMSDVNRSIINSFTLEGGVTVHLAPSTKGVTVYKVVRDG